MQAKGSEQQRKDTFAILFQRRYRKHEGAQIAVGVKFPTNGRIKLLCPARLEPWNMDHLAVQIWKEARTDFGRSYDVDIYETYIGTPPVKVGQLRTDAHNLDAVQITYRFPIPATPIPANEDWSQNQSPAAKIAATP